MTLETGRGFHRKYLPYVFTEHGAITAATLLNSPRAAEISVYVVRAFVQLREFLASNKELARQLKALEQRIEKKIGSHDQAIAGIIDTLRQLTTPSASKRRIEHVDVIVLLKPGLSTFLTPQNVETLERLLNAKHPDTLLLETVAQAIQSPFKPAKQTSGN